MNIVFLSFNLVYYLQMRQIGVALFYLLLFVFILHKGPQRRAMDKITHLFLALELFLLLESLTIFCNSAVATRI